MIGAMTDLHTLEESVGPCGGVRAGDAGVQGSLEDVVQHRPGQIEHRVLEDESHARAADLGAVGIGKGGHLTVAVEDDTLPGTQHQREEVEQRRLPPAGGPGHRRDRSGRERVRQPLEHPIASSAVPEAQLLDADHPLCASACPNSRISVPISKPSTIA